MAENLCFDALNGNTNPSNLLPTNSNHTQITMGHDCDARPPLCSSFPRGNEVTSNMNTLLTAVNSVITTSTTTNLTEKVNEFRLNVHLNAAQQRGIPPTPNVETNLLVLSRPIAPSPLTMASGLTRETSTRTEKESMSGTESTSHAVNHTSTDLGEKESEVNVSAMHTSFERSEQGTYLSIPVANDVRALSCTNEDAFDEGYDSDGQHGPFFDAVFDEVPFEHYEEEPVEGRAPAVGSTVPANVAENEVSYTPLSEITIQAMTVKNLKDELKKRKQAVGGKKDELVQRLLSVAHLPPVSTADPEPVRAEPTNDQPDSCFHHEAKWRLLELDTANPIDDPSSNMPGLVAPTTHAVGGTVECIKYNFNDTFDRDPFIALSKECAVDRHGNPKKDKDQNYVMVEAVRKKGRPTMNFLEKNRLTVHSHPAQWIEALLPTSSRNPNAVTLDQWTMFTNMKAFLAQAGHNIYQGIFQPFTTTETKRFLGLLLLHGLSPSPQISYKFQTQEQNPVNGNDLVSLVFGSSAEKRYKMWKTFFGVQDPRKEVPSTKTHPNFKIDLFLQHIMKVSIDAWDMGEVLSCDEQDIGFTGRHQDKQRVNYKDEGDGFLTDSLCQDGYTYSFYFRNMPAPKKYLDKGFSPTHSRVLFLFDTLKDKNHVVGLDNLFMSAKLAYGAYTGKNQVKIHGVVRKTHRGVPTCVFQETKKNPNEAALVRGTIKAAVLEGDPKCPDVCVLSFYDSKDVYLMSTACSTLKWVEKERRVFDKTQQKMVKMKFLRHQMIDDYNNFMNKVDQADQLRNQYRCDHWTRTRKWWWAIWLWGLQVLCVNAYVLYKHAHLYIWKSKKSRLLTHYEFQKLIALHWLDPEQYPVKDSEAEHNAKKRRMNCSNSTVTSKKTTRASTINDDSIAQGGSLYCRLSSKYFHYPVRPTAKDPTCSLHRWASKDNSLKFRAQIMTCECCNVSLCLDCFGPFHTISDVKRLKSEIRKIICEQSKKKN